MLELLKNEQLLLGERSESDHSSKKECFLTLTCPMATPIAHRALPPLQLPLSGRCQDRPIYVRMTKFMLSPIFFLPWKCRSPQKPSSILSDCTWSGNSLLKLKTKFEYKGGCGRLFTRISNSSLGMMRITLPYLPQVRRNPMVGLDQWHVNGSGMYVVQVEVFKSLPVIVSHVTGINNVPVSGGHTSSGLWVCM